MRLDLRKAQSRRHKVDDAIKEAESDPRSAELVVPAAPASCWSLSQQALWGKLARCAPMLANPQVGVLLFTCQLTCFRAWGVSDDRDINAASHNGAGGAENVKT